MVGAETEGDAAVEAAGEPGPADLAGEDGEPLAGAGVEESESGADFATEGALVMGGGLCTGGFVTEADFWTGLGFWA